MKKILLAIVTHFLCLSIYSQSTEDSLAAYNEAVQNYLDSINKAFVYEKGTINLEGGFAKINVPKGLKFLNAAQSKTVLEDLWGNPKDNDVLGMLFPEKYTPMDSACWAFTVTFSSLGYVKDDDAEDINYNELLENMKKETKEGNAERIKAGFEPVEIVGWASQPFYDKERKVLHWAKEIKFGESPTNTLNYDVRVLGRKGVLSLNAVGGIAALPEVKPVINYVLSSVEFTESNKYSDFNPDIDQVAAWTIGGLVAGKVLAKVGLWALIVKFGKFIVLGIAAAGAGVWKWLKGRSGKKEEEVQVPEKVPTETEA